MNTVNPYLNFSGNCEEAFKFYQSVFGGELQIIRYKNLKNNMGLAGNDLNLIGNAMLLFVNGTKLYGGDVPDVFLEQPLTEGNMLEINIESDSANEAQRLFDALSQEGQIKMPLQEAEWAEKYGMLIDRFKVNWMIMYAGTKRI